MGCKDLYLQIKEIRKLINKPKGLHPSWITLLLPGSVLADVNLREHTIPGLIPLLAKVLQGSFRAIYG